MGQDLAVPLILMSYFHSGRDSEPRTIGTETHQAGWTS